MKILMVCLGNICRSPLAQGILENRTTNSNITVDSAGTAGYHTGSPPDKRAIEIAEKHNIELRHQRARQFSIADFEKFDIIYAMDKNNYAHLIALTKNQEERKKIRMILNETSPGLYKSVPDPYYGGKNGFEEVYNMLDKACNKIADQIE
tara:strand:+ start:9174 stop:9623 length:450 start_codon:yes stop_codon:yes gene_type:complete